MLVAQVIKKEFHAKIVSLLFIIFSLIWIYANFFQPTENIYRDIFTNVYGLIALSGGISGLLISRKWGGFHSAIGKSMIFFSFGLLAQDFGQLSYNYYYYILGTDLPYPSIGDLGYWGSIPLYLLGMYFLGQSVGIKSGFRNLRAKLFSALTIVVVLFSTYLLFLRGVNLDFSQPLIFILDAIYPVTQSINVSALIIIYVLSRKYMGGIMRPRVLFLIGAYTMQYISDYTFLYQIGNETWIVAGINEYMYMFSYFLMSIGLIQLKTVSDNLTKASK